MIVHSQHKSRQIEKPQRIDAASAFHSISGPVPFLNKPVFIAGITGCRRRKLQRIAAGIGHASPDFIGVFRLIIEIFPVYDVPLRMIRNRKPEIVLPGKVGHRDALRLGQRKRPHIIPRSGKRKALCKFDFLRLLPAGGIVQIQVDAADIGLPPVREEIAG